MKLTRRSFAKKILGCLPFAAVGSLLIPVLRFTLFSYGKTVENVTIQKNRLVSKITKIDNPPMFIIAKNEIPTKVLDSHCTHMGCIVNFDSKINEFICPCHGSRYNINGINIKGPTKKPLYTESFKLLNNKIKINYIYYEV